MSSVNRLSRRGLLKQLAAVAGLSVGTESGPSQSSAAAPTIATWETRLDEVRKESSRNWLFDLNGADWSIASFQPGEGRTREAFAEGFPTAEALPATVPGDIHWDLERAHRLPQIYYGLNSREIGWVAEREWWYRRSFLHSTESRGRDAWLRFSGVDYSSEVWLNGQWLVQYEGQFTPFETEVSRCLRYGSENQLTVLIHPVPSNVREEIAKWSDPSLFDVSSGEWPVMQAMRAAYPCWKSMTSSGWEWGPKIIRMGIWKDVCLTFSRGLHISRLIVRPRLRQRENKAILRIQLSAQVGEPIEFQLVCRVRSLTSNDVPATARQTVVVAPANPQAEFEMEIPNPRLWWPYITGQILAVDGGYLMDGSLPGAEYWK